jgi:hypothetical protein
MFFSLAINLKIAFIAYVFYLTWSTELAGVNKDEISGAL